jgi:large subunit ribosomal protein L30e
MAKQLEKALTNAIKERKRTLGAKQVISSMGKSKLVVISKSVPSEISQKIVESAQNNDVPLLHFHDTSVILGKLCGLQFSVSAISINSLSNTNVQAILKEYEKK